ncbi:MAG: hypothetical protein Q4C86_07660 [bacterium]|nr:hypothetical protein [bacterium]
MTRRAEIRARVVDILKTHDVAASANGYPTEAEERVFANRKRKLGHAQLPCILVYTQKESCEVYDQAPRSYKKTLTLMIGVVAEENDTLDDTLDRICGQVETVFNEDMFLGAGPGDLVEECSLISTEMGLSIDCDVQTGAAAMTFNVVYIEDAVNSGLAEPNRLVPFKRVYSKTRPAGSSSDTPTEKDAVELDWES